MKVSNLEDKLRTEDGALNSTTADVLDQINISGAAARKKAQEMVDSVNAQIYV